MVSLKINWTKIGHAPCFDTECSLWIGFQSLAPSVSNLALIQFNLTQELHSSRYAYRPLIDRHAAVFFPAGGGCLPGPGGLLPAGGVCLFWGGCLPGRGEGGVLLGPGARVSAWSRGGVCLVRRGVTPMVPGGGNAWSGGGCLPGLEGGKNPWSRGGVCLVRREVSAWSREGVLQMTPPVNRIIVHV